MYCRVCDIEYPKSLRYCKWCGGALADKDSIGSQHCPACGSSVNREWLFCNECGVDLASISAQPRDQTCPSCSAAVRKGWMFCRQCGEQIVTERAEMRCDVCGGGMRAGWHYCKQCGAAGTSKGASMGGKPADSARFATVVGIPAVGTEVNEDEPFSGLGSGELPSVDAMIDSDRKNRPAPNRRVTGAPQPGETRNITFGKNTGPMDSRDLPANQSMPVAHAQSEDDSLRTVAMEIAPELRRTPPKQDSKAQSYQVPAAFSNHPTVAIPAVPEAPEPPAAAKGGFQVPSGFSNQPTVAIPALPDEPAAVDTPRATPSAPGSYQVPSAFSNQPTVAIPAVPDVPEPPAARSGFQVPQGFSNNPTVAIPAVPDEQDSGERVGVQAPAGFSPLPTVTIPSVPDPETGGDDAVAGHAVPSGFSGSPTLAFPSVPSGAEEQIDPYSTFDPNQPGEAASPSQGLATTIIAAPKFPPHGDSGVPSDHAVASAAQGNAPYESASQAHSGAPSATVADVKTTHVEKAAVAGATGGSSALKWVAVAVVVVAVLAAAAAGGLFLLNRSRTADPGPVAQPSTPVTTPAPTAEPPKAPTIPDDMVAVAGGSFTVGSEAADADEYSKPAHIVTVKPFLIDKTEVTNAQYKEFVDKTGHKPPSHWVGGSIPAGDDTMPVVNVSWSDAADYAKWAGKRLPTEIEWEVAARGSDGRMYSWGSNWDPAAANVDQKAGALKPVGSFPTSASPCGAMDMIGNVWEWTASDYDPYPGSTAPWPKDEAGKERRPIKIIRGGAFSTGSKVNATWRGFYEPNKPGDRLGFRCVKDAS